MKHTPWEELEAQVALGSEAFVEQVQARLQSDQPEGARGHRRVRRADYETVMRVVKWIKGERREAFWNRYGDEGRDLVLCVARECCGLTLKELEGRRGDGG